MCASSTDQPGTTPRVLPAAVAPQGPALRRRGVRRVLEAKDYIDGIRRCDRGILGRAFSLMESHVPAHRVVASEVLNGILSRTGNAVRLGISGVPGAGKSTLIEALGMKLIGKGHKVAVLAVDPSSAISGGSILGDKTRMEKLALHESAMVRPSAAGRLLGGVARGTRESVLVCEAAGYDVVIVETVGVGQSESAVASMVDFFLLLMLTGGGDELQGIKRGVLELADGIAINKADGENARRAQVACTELRSALRLLRPSDGAHWAPKVLPCSAVTGVGLDDLWQMVRDYEAVMKETGRRSEKRRLQAAQWMTQATEALVLERFFAQDAVRQEREALRHAVEEGQMAPLAAAERLAALAQHSTSSEKKGTRES